MKALLKPALLSSGSGLFFTVLLYAPSMAKLRDEEYKFCNKIVILNIKVFSDFCNMHQNM